MGLTATLFGILVALSGPLLEGIDLDGLDSSSPAQSTNRQNEERSARLHKGENNNESAAVETTALSMLKNLSLNEGKKGKSV